MKNGIVRDQRLATLVAEEISLILCSADDSRLSDLLVTRVDAMRGGKQFVVYIEPDQSSPTVMTWAEAKVILERASGYMRSSLATALNLKRAPELKFVLDPFYSMARNSSD